MGLECPVCDLEQADAVHLANHLGVTASLGRDDHLAWLDEHAPAWGEMGSEELAAIVAERAVETPAGHDTTSAGGPPNSARGRPSFEDALASQAGGTGREPRSEETEAVLEEARELTRKRREGADGKG